MMKKTVAWLMVVTVALTVCGCSREGREEAMDRVAAAGRALNGGDTADRTPDVVRKQQEAEARRQNKEWTTENQSRHPVEYCQAQMRTLDEMAKKLEAEQHRLNTQRASTTRKVSELGELEKRMEKQLDTLKGAYRAAAAGGGWPVKYNGFDLSEQKAKEMIVQTNEKLTGAREQKPQYQAMLTRLERRLEEIQGEQKRLVQTREKVQMTISNLQTKEIVEGERGISDALSALNDSMESLGGSFTEASFEDISLGTRENELDAAFEALMAE